MTGIRVLHELRADDGLESALLDYTQGLRKETGCVEAEHYRGVADSHLVGIVELWQDQYLYGEHWARVVAEPGASPVVDALSGRAEAESTTEFYRHQYFYPDRGWAAADSRGRTQRIFWPAAGAVRFLYQGSHANVDGMIGPVLDNARETLREPGCEQFEWFRSTEFPNHVLVLELWRDQAVYDAHWQLRIASGSATDGGAEPAPREQGSNGLEFYRKQEFIHLYDRWLPADVSSRSETVIWAD